MVPTEEGGEFRLRPRKPRLSRNKRAGWSSGFKLLMHYARSTSKRKIRRACAGKGRPARPYRQRCAVRVTYLNSKIHGQWKAHGRYLVRESAAHGAGDKRAGFSRDNESIDLAAKLEAWQKAGDQRLWKLIVSPEFGERADLIRLTRDLMRRMAQDLATELEWIAVEHYNTEHPHVHIAVRGLRADGAALRMSCQYVQQGIREIAEHLCTYQLGYRTQLDAAEGERREIAEKRFTSIDRQLVTGAREIALTGGQQYLAIETVPARDQHKFARLAVLQHMGLAQSTGAGTWLIRRDFEQVLRAMQRAADRQKTLAVHGVLLSDERLPIEVLDPSRMTTVEGRVLVHGQDEQSGRNYLMLESTQAKVYFIHYTPEIEDARSRGELRVNAFVRIAKTSPNGPVQIEDLRNADRLLSNQQHFTHAAKKLLNQGMMPVEDGWGGWLGQYQAALAKCASEIAQQEPARSLIRQHEHKRQRDRSLGR
jgi:type IV secretory pathway VirD2 relaxase